MGRLWQRERSKVGERQQGLAQPLSLPYLTSLSLPESTYLPTPYAHLLYARFSLCNRSELPETKVVVMETSIIHQIDRTMFLRFFFIFISAQHLATLPEKHGSSFVRGGGGGGGGGGGRAETVPQVPSPRQERRIPLFFSFPPHTLHYSAELIIALIYKGKTEEEEIDKKRCFCCYLYEEEYAVVCRRQVKAPNQGKIKSESRLKR